MVPIPVFLPLLLLLEMVVLMTAREVSVEVVSFNDVRNVRSVSRSGVIQWREECEKRSREMCVGHGKRDIVIVFAGRLFQQLRWWWHLCWLQHQELNHLWSRDDTCTGFNIKNSTTCDYVITHVLASTSRTQPPVITWWHLCWLQHQELNHLWSHDDTCAGFNITNSTTCDHMMAPVLASTSRTQPPVITWWHLCWLQHQEPNHLWSRDDHL